MMKMRACFVVLLTLVAAVAAPAAPSGSAYRALGTEPFWSLEIGPRRMTFGLAGEADISVPTPPRQARPGRVRYRSARIAADIVSSACSDGMSMFMYADTVTVTVDNRRFEGCGGPHVLPEHIAGTEWQIVEVGDARVGGETWHLEFQDNRYFARLGCNRFSGRFAQRTRTLTFNSTAASTRMHCSAAQMRLERRAAAVFHGPLRMGFANEILTLRGRRGAIRLRQTG